MSTLQLQSRSALALSCGVLIAILATGCGGGATAPGKTVQSVVVTPDSVGLTAGGSLTLAAEARDAAAHPITGQRFFWSTSDSLIATVTQAGVVTAKQPGIAQVSASTEGKSGFAHVIVVSAVVHSVTVSPTRETIYASDPGNTTTLTATTYDAQGNVLTGRPVLWSSSNGVAAVNGGVVTGTNTAPGVAVITATSPDSGFPSGSAQVTVRGHVAIVTVSPSSALLSVGGQFGLPQSVQLQVTLTDSFGHDVTDQRTVTWSSADPSVASVDPHTGLVQAVGPSTNPVAVTATTADNQTGGSALIAVFN